MKSEIDIEWENTIIATDNIKFKTIDHGSVTLGDAWHDKPINGVYYQASFEGFNKVIERHKVITCYCLDHLCDEMTKSHENDFFTTSLNDAIDFLEELK